MSAKRPRTFSIADFLDTEAADIDTEDSGLFDDEDEEGDFLDNESPEPTQEAVRSRLPPPELESVEDIEALVSRYRKRAKRDHASEDDDGQRGQEERRGQLWMMYSPTARQASNAERVSARLSEPWRAFAVKALPGRFYICAPDESIVWAACTGLSGLDRARVHHVPATEQSTVLGMHDSGALESERVQVGNWVTVRRGTYQGDFAVVRDVVEGDALVLTVVPRIAPKGSLKPGDRAPPGLFDVEDVAARFVGESVERLGDTKYRFRRHIYECGLRVMTVPGLHSVTKVSPRFDQVRLFAQSGCSLGDLERGEGLLRRGDRVEVDAGTYSSLTGVVLSLDEDIAWVGDVTVNSGEKQEGMFPVARDEVHRVLRSGDHVRVRIGPLEGQTGMIITAEQDALTLYTDHSEQVRVCPKWVETYEPDFRIAEASDEPSRLPGPSSCTDPFAGRLVLIRRDKAAKGYYGYVLDSHPAHKTARVARDSTTTIDVVNLADLISVDTITCLDEDYPLSHVERVAHAAKFRDRGMLVGKMDERPRISRPSTPCRASTPPPTESEVAATSGNPDVWQINQDDRLRVRCPPAVTNFSSHGMWLLRPEIQVRLATHHVHFRHLNARYGFTTRTDPGGNHEKCVDAHNGCRLTVDLSTGHKILRDKVVYVRELDPRYPDRKNTTVMVICGAVEENIGTILTVLGLPTVDGVKVARVCRPGDRKNKWHEPLAHLTIVDEI